jgi:diaminopimelate decarboxylase
MFIKDNGQIYLEGVSLVEIAEKYGTPVYVYEENKIRENFRKASEAFKKYYNNFRFYYAVKGCSNLAIMQILKQEGAGMDAASVNEILLANKIGMSGEDIIFSGNFLSDEDLIKGLESKVIFNLDDISLLPRLLKFGKPEVLSFRINPGYGYSDLGMFVTLGGEGAKFGIHPDQVMEAYRMAKEAGIKRFGAHMMPGSCVRNPKYFEYVTGLLMDLIGNVGQELGINFEFVDLGGGLGIPYTEEEHELDIDETARLVADMFNSKLEKYKLQAPKLLMEPARYFVGNAGYIVGKVHSIKKTYSNIVGTDIGMNILARPALYDSYHHIYVNGKEKEERSKMNLCGQICENTDLWVKDRMLPANITEGDIVLVENTGAYGHCMSYPYNGRLRPAEVLINGDKHYLIRERESFESTVRDMSVPEHLKKSKL